MKYVVCQASEIPVGMAKAVEVAGHQVCIFNLGGEFAAISNHCPHEGAELSYGKLVSLVQSDTPGSYTRTSSRPMVKCPWHGWEFDVRTGQSWCRPNSVKTRSYTVALQNDTGLTEGPYSVETFPTGHDGAYLVIEI